MRLYWCAHVLTDSASSLITNHIEKHLVSYIEGFSANVRRIFEFFKLENEIERMREANIPVLGRLQVLRRQPAPYGAELCTLSQKSAFLRTGNPSFAI